MLQIRALNIEDQLYYFIVNLNKTEILYKFIIIGNKKFLWLYFGKYSFPKRKSPEIFSRNFISEFRNFLFYLLIRKET